MNNKTYTQEELQQLHHHLKDILLQVDRVCQLLNIRYFVDGGTAMGAYYEQDLLPWDDDIDLAMERDQYERFLREAPTHLPKGYVLQHPGNEANSPHYFAKVRKRGTLFEGVDEVGIEMEKGIYIDIFPMDRVPDNRRLEERQRNICRTLVNLFIIQSTKMELEGKSQLKVLLFKAIGWITPRKWLYSLLNYEQCRYNHLDTKFINMIRMPRDHIERACVNPPERINLGGVETYAPYNLKQYLDWHYPGHCRYPSEDKRVNHYPNRLIFNYKK